MNYFGIDPKAGACLRFAYDGQKFHVWQFSKESSDVHYVGAMIPIGNDQWPTSNEFIADLYVTPRQRVLPFQVEHPERLPMLEAVTFKVSGNYVANGSPVGKHFLMALSPKAMTLTVVLTAA